MGRNAKKNFMKCEQVIGTSGGGKSMFDLWRVNVGEINPRSLGNGVRYIGTLTELNLDIWTYDEYYVDEWDNNTEKAMMPEDKVLLGNPAAYARRQYGAIQDLSALASVARYPKSWTEEDPSARFVMLQSAPLPSLHQVDAFLCATVL
jgi:hypothetical protein